MTTSFITSDLHDGHRAIGKYRSTIIPSIVDVKTNREFIGDNWRAGKRDTVYLLGDIFFAKDSHVFIDSLPGQKVLIMGNHDVESNSRSTIKEITSVCRSIHGIIKKKIVIDKIPTKIWLQHTPMHPMELRNMLCGHGHIHDTEQDFMNVGSENYDKRYINFNIDAIYPRTGKIMLEANEISDYYNQNWNKLKGNIL